ncbi:MAG TPA: phosphate ABC transporter permease subunit PstC [Jatrophihabitans sp.]|jgi:phosphate transport system permease protein|uniref:phosphate ABC transporter permease subunit PstC n=1 Tax=Jatrophihabitans sp. TaxID=1932789 RepID=UPI002DF91C7C|nr:phosphate ABC transporter permease subunit PstC [Jatrophihabitans sp.]
MSEREIMTERSEPREPLPAPRVGGESVEPVAAHDGRRLESPIESEVALGGRHTDASKVSGSGIASGGGRARFGDRIFLGLSSAAAVTVILIVVLIATFLLIKSVPSIADDKVNFLTSTEWGTDPGNLRFGIANLLWVTVIISLIALVVAVPIAVGIALFITQYAPARVARPVAYVIDLLAAIPSIVYGIWGATVLATALEPVQRFLAHIPLPLFDFKQPNSTIFDGAVVLAVMILPIITAISRDVFERTPIANIEAALALGATRYEMIRMAVLPYGRAGVVSGSMLGLGRALGETIAVYLILSTVGGPFSFSILRGGETFASKIANGSAEFNNPQSTGAYIAAGLVLFVLTFVVNSAARAIVNRRKDFA